MRRLRRDHQRRWRSLFACQVQVRAEPCCGCNRIILLRVLLLRCVLSDMASVHNALVCRRAARSCCSDICAQIPSVLRSMEAWPWGAHGPERKAATARSSASGKRVQAAAPVKPAAKRGRGGIAAAPPARGRGRGVKRCALGAISEEPADPATASVMYKRSKRSTADGDDSLQNSSQSAGAVHVNEDDAAAVPGVTWQRHRLSAAEKSHMILDDEEDADMADVAAKPAGLQNSKSSDHGVGRIPDQLASRAPAAPRQGSLSLLERLTQGVSTQPTPSLSMTLSIPTGSQHSDGALPSPAHRLQAPAPSVEPAELAQEDAHSAQQRAAAAGAETSVPSVAGGAALPPTRPRAPMSLRQRFAALKAMKAQQAGAA